MYGTPLQTAPGTGDMDCDGVVCGYDFPPFEECMTGPAGGPVIGFCLEGDFGSSPPDGDVDLRDLPEDDTAFAACRAGPYIYLHHSYVTGRRWAQAQHGAAGLAVMLFSEWRHMEEPYWSERQCQEWLQRWRQEVGWETIAPEIHHEWTDGGSQP